MAGTSHSAPQIKAVNASSVHRICSGQVVVDLATAVKELVENALDAGATRIEVKLMDGGTSSLEVVDNGSGIHERNYQAITLKHHTSKISSFEDLDTVASYGFRGEALSSLCELAGTFTVTTRTVDMSKGAKLSYQRDGTLESKNPAAHSVGTTVLVQNLFEGLPVRRNEFLRTAKRHYAKLLSVLQAYATVSTGVRLSCSNHVKGKRTNVLSTKGSSSVRDNIAAVFGSKFVRTLCPVEFDIANEGGDEPTAAGSGIAAGEEAAGCGKVHEGGTTVRGLVSKIDGGVGRSNSDRQFWFANGRPIDLPRGTRVVDEVWRQYEMKHRPAFVICLSLPPGSFDVNINPDKRELMMRDESVIFEELKARLNALWEPSRGSFKATPIDDLLSSSRRALGHAPTALTDGAAVGTAPAGEEGGGRRTTCRAGTGGCGGRGGSRRAPPDSGAGFDRLGGAGWGGGLGGAARLRWRERPRRRCGVGRA